MGNVQAPPDLMTYGQVAEALGITRQSVRTAVSEHRLHSVKVPGIQHKFIKRAEVAEYRQRNRSTEVPQALAPVAQQQQLSPEDMQAYAQAWAAPIESLAKNTAREAAQAAAQAATQAAMQEAVPGAIAMVLGGFQVLRGQQPTIDPKVLAV